MLIESLIQDVRYGVRGIQRAPLFAASVASTIGLGLGVLCAAFTIVNADLLNPIGRTSGRCRYLGQPAIRSDEGPC